MAVNDIYGRYRSVIFVKWLIGASQPKVKKKTARAQSNSGDFPEEEEEEKLFRERERNCLVGGVGDMVTLRTSAPATRKSIQMSPCPAIGLLLVTYTRAGAGCPAALAVGRLEWRRHGRRENR